MGFFYPSQQAARHMSANQAGHIVTITASIAEQPNAKVNALLPILIKGGLNHATRGLAIELAGSNVQVNAVAPGIIRTPMHGTDEGTQNFLKGLSPANRVGETDDIVNAVLYLTDSSFVSGTVAVVDGGAAAGTW
jgi:NAD(P)-dependent dehydrogenase (short-subunit alcohol dehydrogenase family)